MGQWLRTLTVLAKDLGLVLSAYKEIHNCLQLQFQGMQCILLASQDSSTHVVHISARRHMCAQNNK